jgi:hypothetical protein
MSSTIRQHDAAPHLQYISLGDFSGSIYTYSYNIKTRVGVLAATGVSSANAAARVLLRSLGRTLKPGINPAVTTPLISVGFIGASDGLAYSGFIDAQTPGLFALYSTEGSVMDPVAGDLYSSGVFTSGDIHTTGNLIVVGDADISGAMLVTGAGGISGALDVSGALTVAGGAHVTGTTLVTGALTATGVTTVCSTIATPAGGAVGAVLLFGTTSGFGIYYGSGAPSTLTAGRGSIYLRSDGSSTSTRMYVNTDAGITWTNFTTGA